MKLRQSVCSFFKWIWRKLRQWVRLFAQRQPRRSISLVTQSEVSSPNIHQSVSGKDAQQVGTVGKRAKVARDIGRDLQQADVINNFYGNVDAPLAQAVNLSAPFPRVRLPDNYVERPESLKAVKELLLAEDGQTLVVSAIAGLGGLGKSVLAIALVLDEEVRSRFADGILWVTLGQNPDLQTLLADWISQLDKSRDTYSANTKEAASQYLHNLLAEKQMLLVVDDVWNTNHAEWFRVGGDRCRVLVTTREARIKGAKFFPLTLMTENEAVELVRGKLKGQWQASDEADVKAFAKVLGYLPLALDLAANQVRDGFGWTDLQCEFEAERRSVALGMGRRSSALKLLDSSEKWDDLDESEQREYSLQACFNLSLKRLTPEQLQQFAWLGILPEDVNLNQQVAAVLWGVRSVEAKRLLVLLRNRSFLTDSVSMLEEEPTYRIHDLMHDMARSLIEEGILEIGEGVSGVKDRPLSLAHRHFLERYRVNCHQWDELPNDGYIHRHLTWHMVQADWSDEIHALLEMSDRLGRNAWFEACDRLGKPAIFVQDVGRAWEIAESGYEGDQVRSIVLQCRYALITATLSSLIENLPIGMMVEFVKNKFWSVEQAWAYVEQMQSEYKITEAIQALSPYLSKVLFQEALKVARSIEDIDYRVIASIWLAKVDGANFSELLEAARSIQHEETRYMVLSELAKVDGADFSELLEAAQAFQDEHREYRQAMVLRELTKVEGADFSELLEAARTIQSEFGRASVLSELAKVDGVYFSEAMAVAQAIEIESSRAEVLIELTKVDGADFSELLEAVQTIQDEYSRARALIELTKVDRVYFSEAMAVTQAIKYNVNYRAEALITLAEIDGANFSELLKAARSIQDEYSRARALIELTKVDDVNFLELLEVARSIQDESSRALLSSELTKVDGADFLELLKISRKIQDESSRARALIELTKIDRVYFSEALAAVQVTRDNEKEYVLIQLAEIDGADFSELLKTVQAIQDIDNRASVLSELAKVDRAYFSEALDVARAIQDKTSRAWVLSKLAKVDRAYFSEALAAAQAIQDDEYKANDLMQLAEIDGADFSELLKAARSIQDEDHRARVLIKLTKVDSSYFSEALEAVRANQNKYSLAYFLIELIEVDEAYFSEALKATRSIQDEYHRADRLSKLTKVDGADFSELLEAARAIQNESSRAMVLIELTKVDGADFLELLEAARAIQNEDYRAKVLIELTKIDRVYFSEALEATRSIQNEYDRADRLSELTKVDGADFSELLEAARAIQNEDYRAKVLIELTKIDRVYFLEALEAVRVIQSASSRADVLRELAQWVPQELFSKVWKAIFEVSNKSACALAISDSLPRLPLATVSHSDWSLYLHILAHRKRSDLMQDLVTLYPAILHLGGDTAMRGVVDSMREICNQWK